MADRIVSTITLSILRMEDSPIIVYSYFMKTRLPFQPYRIAECQTDPGSQDQSRSGMPTVHEDRVAVIGYTAAFVGCHRPMQSTAWPSSSMHR